MLKTEPVTSNSPYNYTYTTTTSCECVHKLGDFEVFLDELGNLRVFQNGKLLKKFKAPK